MPSSAAGCGAGCRSTCSLVPLAILVATYALVLNGWPLLVTTTILYLGAWHRGRQNLGIARYYQRRVGGPVSSAHRWLLAMAFYRPWSRPSPTTRAPRPTHEGEAFHGLSLDPGILWGLGGLAVASVVAYLGWTIGRTAAIGDRTSSRHRTRRARRPPRRAMARPGQRGGLRQRLRAGRLDRVVRPRARRPPRGAVPLLHLCRGAARRDGPAVAVSSRSSGGSPGSRYGRRSDSPPGRRARSPESDALLPFLTAGLLGHYWLDGRIWTARARRLGPV